MKHIRDSFLTTCCAELGYNENWCNCLDVMGGSEAALGRWIGIERECNVEKADQLVSAADAWQLTYQTATDQIDQYKVCVYR